MVSDGRRITLVDFGLAIAFDAPAAVAAPAVPAVPAVPAAAAAAAAPPAQPFEALRTEHQAGMRVGVYGYMPPEVWNGEPFGAPVDVFACGVLVARMTCVALPLAPHERVRAALAAAPFAMMPCCPSSWAYRLFSEPRLAACAPPALAALVRRCCEHDANRRPAIAHVCDELLDLL
eukprot:4887507-Prymnesium_polylepis.1